VTDAVVASGKAWAKQIIDLYTDGASDAEVAAELKVTLKEFYKQMGENQVFAQIVDFGRTLSLAFWERLARKNVTNKQFNSPLFAFYMKNRHGWADKTETISTNENTNMNLDALREQVNRDVARYLKMNTPELTDAQRVIASLAADNVSE
jgi:hypothetical protein